MEPASDRPKKDGSLLDLLGGEDPKTTNLDLIIEEKLIEEKETIIRTEHPRDRSDRDRTASSDTDQLDEEDVITVKYLPIGLASRQDESCTITKDKKCQWISNQDDNRTSRSSQHQEREDCEEAKETDTNQSQVRLVEQIRKNLTLFESNREVYELCPAYENRGYLQSLLVQQRHQPTTTRAVSSNQSDQYTQYRASDLTRVSVIPGDVKLQHQHQYQHQPSPQVRAAKRAPDTDKSNSIAAFIKKPLGFVKSAKNSNSIKRNQQSEKRQDPASGEETYKVPVKQQQQQQFSESRSLYLVPVPDSKVHIATKSIKDIVLAHQRLKLSQQSQEESTRATRNRLSQLFASYSFKTSNKRSSASRLRSLSLPRRERVRLSRDLRSSQVATFDNSIQKIRAKVKMPSGKSDKASIVDNKDGTVRISYEPKEVGQHEICLRYNEEPIDESPIVFYVDAVGAAKKKITAYGPGLTHGLAGESCKFSINTGGLGSAKLNVSIEGPSKCPVSLADNKDGTISVSYQPVSPGEYKIKIGFDGKQVVGSPFTTNITDEGRQRSRISVGRASEHTLDLKVNEEDLKALDALIQTPCGLEEPCGLKLLKSGQLAIVFTPREQGEHVVHVRRRGNHISGSPFKFEVLSRDIGDAKQVKVSGKGLKEGKTSADNEILIHTKEAGYGGLSVALEGPGRSEISTKEVGGDGSIKLVYRAPEPGNYSLMVKYADHIVPGSPFNINVTGQGTNPQKESIKKFRKATALAEPNMESHFTFKLPGVSAYDLSAKIHSPQGNAEDVSIVDQGNFVYQVTFVPKEVGLYTLSVRNKDIHISGSPFPYTVGPLLDFGPHRVRCGGPGLLRGCCNKLNEFDVYTREAGAGELVVLVEGPSKAEISYSDRKDGSCSVGYKVSSAGEYRISVLFNDQEIPDSPFRAYIMPLTGEVAKIELGPMPPENMIQLNKPCNMSVIMNGAKGNIEGKVILPSGKLEDCFASPIDAENWGVRFIPRELGIHQVHIKFNKGSSHIPQSPLFIRVGHDNADPASVVAHGHGLKAATVNHASDFIVETCNAGHALLEVHIEGPSKVPMGCAELDEGYKINYTPLAPGDYLIIIKYNGCHIAGSPFKLRAIKQAGSRTVADMGSHELSSLSISTTDREAKQKVEHMPKFKSDASRVYCKGMGLKKAFANKPNVLTVNCSEAGFNMIYASFLGPTRNTIHECSIKHMGGSIYEVKYTCKDRGDAILIVKYGDEQIPGSPFRLECV